MDSDQQPSPVRPPLGLVRVRPRPLTEGPVKTDGNIPPIIAKTVNICVNCVQGAGRAIREPAVRRYHRHYHPRFPHGRKHLIVDGAFVLAILTLLGFNTYLFVAKPSILPSHVRLTWSAPASVPAGAAFTVELRAHYTGDEPLATSTIALVGRGGFRVTDVAPGRYDAAAQTVTLTDIAPGSERTLTVSGAALARDGDRMTIQATFHGAADGRRERNVAPLELPIEGSVIQLGLATRLPVLPAHGEVRDGLSYVFHPSVSSLIDRVAVTTGEVPGLRSVTYSWDGTVPVTPGASGVFPLRIRTAAPGRYTVPFTFSWVPPVGDEVSMGTQIITVEVQEAPMTLRLTSDRSRAALGDTVTLRLSYQGRDGRALDDGAAVYPAVTITGDLRTRVRWDAPRGRVVDATGGPRALPRTDHYARWVFTPVAPGSVTTEDLRLHVPDAIDPTSLSDAMALTVTLTPEMVLTADARGVPTMTIIGDPVTIPLVGALRATAFARYFTPEGDQIGRGPLPPTVGATTTYWVTWDLQSLLTGASDVVARASLPDGVEWMGRVATTEGTAPVYDPATREVVWRVDQLEPTIGAQRPSASASFALAYIPPSRDAGRFGRLLDATHLTGVGEDRTPLDASAPPVTTELVLDQHAKGKGTIRGVPR